MKATMTVNGKVLTEDEIREWNNNIWDYFTELSSDKKLQYEAVAKDKHPYLKGYDLRMEAARYAWQDKE